MKKFPALLIMTPWSLFLSRVGLRATLKNVLRFVFLQSIWHKFNIRFEMGVLNSLELEIRKTQDLAKDFGRRAGNWKAIRKKFINLKNLSSIKKSNKTTITKKKTKRGEKEKKKGQEKKRRKDRFYGESNSRLSERQPISLPRRDVNTMRSGWKDSC